MNDDRHYAVRLLWARDQELFAEYQEKTKPPLAKHEVHIERWIMTSDMDGEGFDQKVDGSTAVGSETPGLRQIV